MDNLTNKIATLNQFTTLVDFTNFLLKEVALHARDNLPAVNKKLMQMQTELEIGKQTKQSEAAGISKCKNQK